MPLEKKPDRYGPPPWVGWGVGKAGVDPGTPDQQRDVSGYLLPKTLLSYPPSTLGNPPSSKVSLGRKGQPPSLSVCMPTTAI